jgi:hypothetical protein
MFSKSGKTQARPRSKCMLKRKPKLIYHIQDKNNKFHSTLAKILNLKNKTKQRKPQWFKSKPTQPKGI